MELSEVYRALEFEPVRQRLSQLTLSTLGQERVEGLRPWCDRELIEQMLDQVAEMREILAADDPLPIFGLKDIRKALAKASHEGSVLTPEELREIALTLSVSRQTHRYFKLRLDKYPRLRRIANRIYDFHTIERELTAAIDLTTCEIRDTASPELADIRRELRLAQERVRRKLTALVEKYQHYLQEPIITLREGRLVIPLKEEFKGRIDGFIHDRSSSGATLFIEPREIFEENNWIRELKIEERREIERILRNLTDKVRHRLEDISESLDALGELDFIYAKAQLAMELKAARPKLGDRVLEILQGRHPVLLLKYRDWEKVVPLDLKMGTDFRTLVITGPNAGGKTVALKTIGILALMTQCGLHIPASPDSQIPVFDRIFVDIGDWQSIEQDLSTFTAHIGHVVEILAGATPQSLVLIDEIGSGTDPAEGAALAMAFLEKLTAIGCLTVVTTHQGALKIFAHELEGAENGSLAFDEETLQPTYRFRVGMPGSSYAFEIARRLGIDEELLRQAQEKVGKEQSQLERFILDLEKKLNRYESLVRQADIKKVELEGLIKLYRQRYEALRSEEKVLKQKALEEAREIISRANALIEHTVQDIRRRQAERESIREAKRRIQELREEVATQLAALGNTQPSGSGDTLHPGDSVIWKRLNLRGSVLSKPDGHGRVWIEAGDMKLQVHSSELQRVSDSPS